MPCVTPTSALLAGLLDPTGKVHLPFNCTFLETGTEDVLFRATKSAQMPSL